jgi:hypothetical protein
MKAGLKVVFCGCLAVVVYLSFRADPHVVSVAFIPREVGSWFDRHDFIRNLLGFGCLALAGFTRTSFAEAGALSIRFPRLGTFRLTAGRWLAGMLGIVVVLEIGQTLLPRRTSDWQDVAAGALAILIVWGVRCGQHRVRPVRFALPAPNAPPQPTGLNS